MSVLRSTKSLCCELYCNTQAIAKCRSQKVQQTKKKENTSFFYSTEWKVWLEGRLGSESHLLN